MSVMSGNLKKKSVLSAFIDATSDAGGIVAAICLLCTALMITYEAFMRYFFNAPTVWVKELSVYFCIAIGFLCAAYALKLNEHFSVTLIVEKLRSDHRRILEIVTTVMGIFYSLVFVYKGAAMALFSYQIGDISSGLMEVPLWIPGLLVPIGGILLTLQFINKLIQIIAR